DSYTRIIIDSTDDLISTTGTWTAAAGTVTVADASGIKEGMYIKGTGIYRNSYVAAVAGNVLTLNGAGTFQSRTSQPITLTMARQCHADVGVRGQIIHNTNGTPNINAIEIIGEPFYYGGFILSNGSGAQASYQTIAFSRNCAGLPFIAKTLGSIDT